MLDQIQIAEKFLRTADHLTYVTYPLMQDGNILKKILLNLKLSMEKVVYILSDKKKDNGRVTEKFNELLNEEEIKIIPKMIDNFRKKEQSSVEFLRKNKLVLMNDDLKVDTINLDDLKEYIQLLKKLIREIKNKYQTSINI
ncbi:MAG: hypothetical protein JSW08_02675 [archaeon]|nr:MAG: hypothetical protein JSW08_02675 [archaeon]